MFIFNVQSLLSLIKTFNKSNTERKIKANPILGEDVLEDHNHIDFIILAGQALKTVNLVLIIMNISYFLGMLFFIYCKVSKEMLLEFDPTETEFFLEDTDIEHQSNVYTAIMISYFSFTSLTTVGFGDYHPVSAPERFLMAFYLLFGVAIFSFIMGTFIAILNEFKLLTSELEFGDELTKFFHVIKRFNGGKGIDPDFQDRMEKYFQYKWDNDKNMAIDDPEELQHLYELPQPVVDKLIGGFMFNKFIHQF